MVVHILIYLLVIFSVLAALLKTAKAAWEKHCFSVLQCFALLQSLYRLQYDNCEFFFKQLVLKSSPILCDNEDFLNYVGRKYYSILTFFLLPYHASPSPILINIISPSGTKWQL